MKRLFAHKKVKPGQRIEAADIAASRRVLAVMCGIMAMCCTRAWGGRLM